MSNSSRVLRIKVPWRRVCAALPAVALVGGGIAVSSPAAPGHNLKAVAVSSEAPAIVVPDTALTVPAAPAVVSPKNPSLAPAPVASKVAAVGGSALVTLDSAGIPVRVVSMPSWELFEAQPQRYRNSVLLPGISARVSVEAASTIGWDRYVGRDGARIGMTSFGASAPAADVYEHFGITAKAVEQAVRAEIARAGSRS